MADVNKQHKYKIAPIKAFTDNYIWAMHNEAELLVVDPGDAKPVIEFISNKGLTLTTILITHHHYDHTGGVAELLALYPNVDIYGPRNPKIANIKHRLQEGDTVALSCFDVEFYVLETPGHTLDHIVFVNQDFVFCGDTLFSAGCGRMFEGTPEVFYASLQKLANLPSQTKVYCTHEYTQANIDFALHVDAQNEALLQYSSWVKQQRDNDLITLPSTIEKERAINPFLRCHTNDIKTADAMMDKKQDISNKNSDIQTFASLRRLKDNF
jgi:hydroxyacylglutathione hydrolase